MLSTLLTPAPKARIVEGKLVLTLANAETPVVWQMDLNDIKISSFEVQESRVSENYILVMSAPKQKEPTNIATFSRKCAAVRALIAASKALENAQGQMHNSGTDNKPAGQVGPIAMKPKTSWLKRIAVTIGSLILLFLVYSFFLAMTLSDEDIQQMRTQSNAPQSTQQSGETSGVPMSADEFLKGQ